MATEPATTRRGELPPELDDPLFRQAIGQFDGALPAAGIDPFVAAIEDAATRFGYEVVLPKFLADAGVERPQWGRVAALQGGGT